MQLKYEKKSFVFPVISKNICVMDPSFLGEEEFDFPVFKIENTFDSNEIKIEVVLNPYFQIHESTLILNDHKVVRWEKSVEQISVRHGHLCLINETDIEKWTNGNYGERNNDYHNVCVSDMTQSCGLVDLMQGGSVFACSFGNWDWHVYFGYDEQSGLARIALPFEKENNVYDENIAIIHDQDEEFNRLNAALLDQKTTVTFISMNLEDMQEGKGNPVFEYDTFYDAMKKAYETDWKTTKLHGPKVKCGAYEFNGEGVEMWCTRNGIPEPQFSIDRYEHHLKQLREMQEKEKDLD